MPSRRGLLDIMASILRAAKDEGPITKTRIVYAANLNFSRAERYLSMMVELGLMEEVDRGGGGPSRPRRRGRPS
jgi:predicted transcriptional regulator